MYSLDDVALGESRILTTFGGNIVIWSAQGNIDAGLGSKTTLVFTPPERLYDNFGDVTLSPTVPLDRRGNWHFESNSAGSAWQRQSGGTVRDRQCGRGGHRASGDFNVAALHVENAANIDVQGIVTGIPTVAAPNVSGLSKRLKRCGVCNEGHHIARQSHQHHHSLDPHRRDRRLWRWRGRRGRQQRSYRQRRRQQRGYER